MRLRYEKCISSTVLKEPTRKINELYIQIDNYTKQLENLITTKYEKEKTKYAELVAKLDAYSPLKTLSRGYSIVEKDKKIIKNIKELNTGDKIQIQLTDGKCQAEVK